MNTKLSTGKIVGLVILAVLIVLVLWLVGSYNSLVTLNENVKTAQADIEAQYQRRFDLIPNLVATAKGIAGLEQSVFENLAQARTKYAGAANGSKEKVNAINEFDGAIARLLIIVENYPTLRSAESFLKLQDQLEGTENRIAVARGNYNQYVNQLNIRINRFPSNIVAKLFGFLERERFKVTQQEASAPPQVEFDFK